VRDAETAPLAQGLALLVRPNVPSLRTVAVVREFRRSLAEDFHGPMLQTSRRRARANVV
jgi:hypothetical protein